MTATLSSDISGATEDGAEGQFTAIDASGTRSRRARHTRDFLTLSVCTCGQNVSNDEIEAQTNVIRCRKSGCETIWVSETHFRGLDTYSPFSITCVV